MSGRYNTKLIKTRHSYSVQEISNLLGINKKSCFRWTKVGLKVLDPTAKPLLVMGDDLKEFLDKKRAKNKVELGENEYFCFTCKKAVKAISGSEKIQMTGKKIGKQNRSQQIKTGLCEFCNKKINLFV
ncbi:MAG: hypothetical protein UX02_C0001G0052 [Candidatus Moranbacteria bacterium GW2011_GWC1_45_18]|nr:MAG: hypothetical protein UT79_C0002G0345 [Candidatus Moranbacteria bacterium GW2011_GWC2_40_12]KKT34184.1 MAG: hypothetical protein UW19_C0001G0079 [Candidatus Moranbacteria bacterium GW2011_GWF2_44_10]KKT70846.1 MAG: hypothetical protein UW66_C0036G0007 [Candidatus Moranbacteria bacterium GW2011_GWF1_44_4]KKU00604.1 MAG: hypothetical protein UX02_C0001G0052 [Candidatus Moranbacteria bacterium GW2011_GWC1_45_18]OGI24443.1 MAG: hypothetical protein A2194_01560 [Candidatus Moranbacteria bacte